MRLKEKFETLKEKIFRQIAERTKAGARFVRFDDIADALDCSRHVVQYYVRKLEKEGLIVYEFGKIRLSDEAAFEYYRTG